MQVSLRNHIRALQSGEYSAEAYAGSLIERFEGAKAGGALISFDGPALLDQGRRGSYLI